MPRRFHFLLCFIALSFAPVTALAQSISLPVFLERTNERSSTQKPDWVNLDDCLRNDILEFPVGLEGFQDQSLQVWAGTVNTDCKDKKERLPEGTCWLVYNEVPDDAISWTVLIRAQDIVAQRTPSDPESGPGAAGEEACTREISGGGVQLNLHFMLVDSGGEILGEEVIWDKTGFDIRGPNAPQDVRAEPGENKLILDWEATSSADIAGYRFFCDTGGASATSQTLQALDGGLDGSAPGSGGGAGLDGGGSGGGGSSGGGSGGGTGAQSDGGGFVLPENCPATALVPGEIVVSVERCGSAGESATSGFATGLENGQAYAVGIAAFDELGNVGPLSEVVCGEPEVVNDFYEIYKSSGGGGGGGYCAIRARPSPFGALAFGVLGLLWAARRRMR